MHSSAYVKPIWRYVLWAVFFLQNLLFVVYSTYFAPNWINERWSLIAVSLLSTVIHIEVKVQNKIFVEFYLDFIEVLIVGTCQHNNICIEKTWFTVREWLRQNLVTRLRCDCCAQFDGTLCTLARIECDFYWFWF